MIACGTGIVIHEAFVVVYLPMVLAYWWYRDAGARVRYAHAAVALLLVLVALLMLLVAVQRSHELTTSASSRPRVR